MITLGEIMAAKMPMQAVPIVKNDRPRAAVKLVDDVKRVTKAMRRAKRIARFEASVRDGLSYSKSLCRLKTKHKGSGGARLEYQMRRIPA